MTIQYIDFTTAPGLATIHDKKESAPSDAVAVSVDALMAFVNQSKRFQVARVDGTSFQVIDTIHRAEICAVADYQLADGQWTDDAEYRAMTIAVCLNQAKWDYRPTIIV